MNNFYTNAKQWGNNILVRGFSEGKRYTSREKFQPTLYQSTNKKTGYTGLRGEPVQPNKFSNINDAKEFVKRYKDVHNMKLYGNEAYQFQWISECYPENIEYDPSMIRTLGIDIETTVNSGFPSWANPLEEVTLIACKDRVTKQITTFGTLDYTPDRPDITYVKCKTEAELFTKFLSWWESDYPDIVTGWNTAKFDEPYLVERIRRVLGDDAVNRLSPFNIVRTREYDEMGQNYLDVDIFGIASLDYLELYKKFTYTKQESYKLDYIGETELGMNKLENPYATFKEFYEKDPQRFVSYNAVDTDIVDGLEGKLKLIELAISLAFMARINFDDVFSPVKMWDTIIYNHLIAKNVVVPFKEHTGGGQRIEGAYVKEPLTGKHYYVASFDLASLYPHIIMALNMSPETIADTMVDVTVQGLLEGDRSKVIDGFSLAANGSMYDMSKKGFLPELMQYYYNQRKVEKKKMLAYKQELETIRATATPDEIRILENKIATSNSLQMALKIALNSAYGACAQAGFRFFDTRIAEGITMSGQLIIQNAEKTANAFVNGLVKKNKDYVCASDTDSLYLVMEDFVNKFCPDKTQEEKLEFMMKACDGKINNVLNDACDRLSSELNWNEKFINFKREAIASTGVWTGKKQYALLVHNNEGVQYAEPELKVMGIALVRSSTPNVVKEPLRQCIMEILIGTESSLQKFVREEEAKFMLQTPEKIAFPRGANNLLKYSNSATIYQKGCPAQVRAALLYNHKVKELGLEEKYETILEGSKIRFVYLKEPNTLRENLVGFTEKLPPEFGLHKFVDYQTMWEKAFISPLEKLTGAVGWNYEEKNTLDSLFE